jgi:hypothetical protein
MRLFPNPQFGRSTSRFNISPRAQLRTTVAGIATSLALLLAVVARVASLVLPETLCPAS